MIDNLLKRSGLFTFDILLRILNVRGFRSFQFIDADIWEKVTFKLRIIKDRYFIRVFFAVIAKQMWIRNKWKQFTQQSKTVSTARYKQRIRQTLLNQSKAHLSVKFRNFFSHNVKQFCKFGWTPIKRGRDLTVWTDSYLLNNIYNVFYAQIRFVK